MKLVQLYSGSFTDGESKEGENSLEKPAMLVYAGKFDSMDGEVSVEDHHIEKLAEVHNSVLSKVKRFATGEVPAKAMPPIQLDHSPLATMTVGRLVGPLEVGEYDDEGTKKKALFGRVKILGRENVEKVKDGRWTHLSIGADLDEGKLNELTITPFPAAPNAAFLSRLAARLDQYGNVIGDIDIVLEVDGSYTVYINRERVQTNIPTRDAAVQVVKQYADKVHAESAGTPTKTMSSARFLKDVYDSRHEGIVIKVYLDETKKCYYGKVGGVKMPEEFQTLQSAIDAVEIEAKKETCKYLSAEPKSKVEMPGSHVNEVLWEKAKRAADDAGADDKYAFATWWYKQHGGSFSKFSKGDEPMHDHEKMKKYLAEYKKCTHEEAEEKLKHMTDEDKKSLAAEIDEHEKKMAAKDMPQGDQPTQTNMSNGDKARFVQLAKSMKDGFSTSKLAARQASIRVRLAGLRSQAKITPAELKKIKIEELSKLSEDALSAVFKSYESREPALLTGQYGTTKAVNVDKLAKDSKKNVRLKEFAESMPFTMKAHPKLAKQLSAIPERMTPPAGSVGQSPDVNMGEEGTEHHAEMYAHMHHAHKLMEEGKHEEAKEHLKHALEKYGHLAHHLAEVPGHEGAHSEMSALADRVKTLQNQMEELVKLAAPVLGISVGEL